MDTDDLMFLVQVILISAIMVAAITIGCYLLENSSNTITENESIERSNSIVCPYCGEEIYIYVKEG